MAQCEVVQLVSISPRFDTELVRRYGALPLFDKHSATDVPPEAGTARVLVTTARAGFDRGLIDRLPALQAVCSWGVGYDTLDIDAAAERGIAVSNTPDVLDDCVADLAWALLLAVARKVAQADHYVKAGRWRDMGGFPQAMRVSGKRLGILGMGRIGRAIAKRAAGFSMDIGYHNRRAHPEAAGRYFDKLTDLADWCDFLVVACPGGPQTRHLVDAQVLRALGSEGILINIARGSIIDEQALEAALRDGVLGGAGLDVLESEPVMPASFRGMDHLVLTPHIGSATRDTRGDMEDLVLANVEAWLAKGCLLTPVR
ncbi:2-hydroxyacid dehydrogenase [Allopusillimonas soli]